MTTNATLPKHIAIIMDGNGRWAKSRGNLRTFGHKKGVEVARDIVQICGHLGINSLSLFAFSSENWQRPDDEVGFIMGLFVDALKSQVEDLHANNVVLRFIGDRSQLKSGLIKKMETAENLMASNTGLNLNVALSYGGKWDIVNACNQIIANQHTSRVTEELIAQHLQTAGQYPVDLLIRTGGEKRISNFLLWQSAYAELIFSDTLWPDYTQSHLQEDLQIFASRQRRYGKTGEQVTKLAES